MIKTYFNAAHGTTSLLSHVSFIAGTDTQRFLDCDAAFGIKDHSLLSEENNNNKDKTGFLGTNCDNLAWAQKSCFFPHGAWIKA